MNLNIFVSKECFFYCKGCYSLSRVSKSEQSIETNNLIKFLRHARDYGIEKLTLCGGDPLIYDDIVNLLIQIKKLNYKISLDTVGLNIIDDYTCKSGKTIKKIDAKILADLVNVIGLPIDGSNNAIIKQFRQADFDLLSCMLKIIEELNKYNANICINTVVHKENINDAKNICNLMNDINGINKWQLFKFAPLGYHAIKNKKLFEISQDEFLSFKNNIFNYINQDKKQIIEFKDFKARDKKYLMIGTSGDAWVPNYSQIMFNNESVITEEREIIGNINNPADWDIVCKTIVREL